MPRSWRCWLYLHRRCPRVWHVYEPSADPTTYTCRCTCHDPQPGRNAMTTPVLEGTVVPASATRRVLGRDPQLIAAGISGVVAFLGLAVFDWSGDLIGGVNAATAAVLAVYVAWGTIDKTTSALIQLLKAGAFLAVTFGAKISADQTALAIIALEGVISAYARTQVSAIVPPPPVPVVPGSLPVTEVR